MKALVLLTESLKAKTELYEYLRKVNGIALYNDKNPLLTEKIFRIINRAVPYSDPTGIELIVEKIPSDLYLKVSVTYQHHTYKLNTNLFGDHQPRECTRLQLPPDCFSVLILSDIADAVEDYQPANNRSQVKSTRKTIL